jgi:hypothetical protein
MEILESSTASLQMHIGTTTELHKTTELHMMRRSQLVLLPKLAQVWCGVVTLPSSRGQDQDKPIWYFYLDQGLSLIYGNAPHATKKENKKQIINHVH